MEWVLDVTTTASASNQYNLDVSNIDFTKYREIMLYIEPAVASTAPALYVRLNGLESYRNSSPTVQNYLCSFGIDVNGKQGYTCVHLCLGKGFISGSSSADYGTESQYFPISSDRLITLLSPSELNTISFIALQNGKTLAAGSRFKMLGIKK